MATFPWETQEIEECFDDLRELAIEAVSDPTEVISPIALYNLANAGWALADDYPYGALVYMLAAVPYMGDESGKTAKGYGLALEACRVGHRLRDDAPVWTIKDAFYQLVSDRHQMAYLRQRYRLYRRSVGSVVTARLLHAVMPKLSRADIDRFLKPLNAALVEFEIVTPQRWMPFLAECAEESIELQSMTELPSSFASSASTFKGRGAMQLTGKANYRAAGKALGLDLEHHPDWVASDAAVGFRAAGWFWKTHELNERADQVKSDADFDKISNVINRGSPKKKALHQDVRRAYYHKALAAWRDYKNRCCMALEGREPVDI